MGFFGIVSFTDKIYFITNLHVQLWRRACSEQSAHHPLQEGATLAECALRTLSDSHISKANGQALHGWTIVNERANLGHAAG